ncbi:MAG: hypothetical protein JWP25_2415 [Bradyrhizobium sp.]|nr:hypothetical protein [Bradyrhizobium sp.]
MTRLIRAGATTLAIVGNLGFACGQNALGEDHPELNATQQRAVNEGLANSPSQPAPSGERPKVGDKVPDSMTAQSVPDGVSDQVPELKNLLFVKLPDRIILIDPDSKLVSEVVISSGSDSDSATTGSNSNGSVGSSSGSSNQRHQ